MLATFIFVCLKSAGLRLTRTCCAHEFSTWRLYLFSLHERGEMRNGKRQMWLLFVLRLRNSVLTPAITCYQCMIVCLKQVGLTFTRTCWPFENQNALDNLFSLHERGEMKCRMARMFVLIDCYLSNLPYLHPFYPRLPLLCTGSGVE